MIVRLANAFPADAVEAAVPDVATARRLIGTYRPDVGMLLAHRRDRLLSAFGNGFAEALTRCEDALHLGLARFGTRHGSWGCDFHHYHNENHALEVLDCRLGRLLDHAGVDALSGSDWLALSLFATCHDLRQREALDFLHPIGNNEAASIAETLRILHLAGFEPVRDRGLFLALELMIAGSTFNTRPTPPTRETNSAELAASGGALAPKLAGILDVEQPGWRNDADAVRAVALAQIASDLDTANVAEPLTWLAESASRLCQEREMRSGRKLDAAESGPPCARFLGTGQEHYFFNLHRFCSELGQATFEVGKQLNAARLHAVTRRIHDTWPATVSPRCGADVLRMFSALALAAA